METKEVEIFWDDLKEGIQKSIAEDRNTTPEKFCEDGNYDTIPIAVISI